jgi:hypothetical protein
MSLKMPIPRLRPPARLAAAPAGGRPKPPVGKAFPGRPGKPGKPGQRGSC